MKALVLIFILSFIVKFLFAAFLPVFWDETYYWVWSLHPQLSYYDHPGMVSWLISLAEKVPTFGYLFRWPFLLLSQGTLLLWILILNPYLTKKELSVFSLLMSFSLLLGVGSVLATPDSPLMFFWTLSLFFFIKALESPNIRYYFLFGASLGLGFCSKYHIVLFVPAAIIYLSLQKKWGLLSWRGIVITFLSGLLFSLPVLVWNLNNNFASFRFQLNHGLGGQQWSPEWSYSYIVGQVLVIFPSILFLFIKNIKQSRPDFLKYFALFPLGFFLISSLRGHVEINWPIIALPAVFAVVVFGISQINWSVNLSLAFSTLLIGALIIQWGFPKSTFLPDKTLEPIKYDPLLKVAESYRPLYTDSYQLASFLWYKTKMPTYKIRDMTRFDFFDTLGGSVPHEKLFFLAKQYKNSFPEWLNKKIIRSRLLGTMKYDVEIWEIETQ